MGKIYISGAISALSKEGYEYNFKKAEELLKFNYPQHKIINPLNIPSWKNGTTWSAYMRLDLIVLATCDEIHVMKNFWRSKGVLTEMLFALILGIKIKFIKMKVMK